MAAPTWTLVEASIQSLYSLLYIKEPTREFEQASSEGLTIALHEFWATVTLLTVTVVVVALHSMYGIPSSVLCSVSAFLRYPMVVLSIEQLTGVPEQWYNVPEPLLVATSGNNSLL